MEQTKFEKITVLIAEKEKRRQSLNLDLSRLEEDLKAAIIEEQDGVHDIQSAITKNKEMISQLNYQLHLLNKEKEDSEVEHLQTLIKRNDIARDMVMKKYRPVDDEFDKAKKVFEEAEKHWSDARFDINCELNKYDSSRLHIRLNEINQKKYYAEIRSRRYEP